MSAKLAEPIVVAALKQMGLLPLYAQRAAGDKRIVWSEDALNACQHDLDTSKMREPVKALWSTYLQHGTLPHLPTVKPATIATDGAYEAPPCMYCKGDIAVCGGVHGPARLFACVQCHKPLMECRGLCQPAMPKARRSTRNRKEDAA